MVTNQKLGDKSVVSPSQHSDDSFASSCSEGQPNYDEDEDDVTYDEPASIPSVVPGGRTRSPLGGTVRGGAAGNVSSASRESWPYAPPPFHWGGERTSPIPPPSQRIPEKIYSGTKHGLGLDTSDSGLDSSRRDLDTSDTGPDANGPAQVDMYSKTVSISKGRSNVSAGNGRESRKQVAETSNGSGVGWVTRGQRPDIVAGSDGQTGGRPNGGSGGSANPLNRNVTLKNTVPATANVEHIRRHQGSRDETVRQKEPPPSQQIGKLSVQRGDMIEKLGKNL